MTNLLVVIPIFLLEHLEEYRSSVINPSSIGIKRKIIGHGSCRQAADGFTGVGINYNQLTRITCANQFLRSSATTRHAQIATTMNVYGNAMMESKRGTFDFTSLPSTPDAAPSAPPCCW